MQLKNGRSLEANIQRFYLASGPRSVAVRRQGAKFQKSLWDTGWVLKGTLRRRAQLFLPRCPSLNNASAFALSISFCRSQSWEFKAASFS